MKPLLAQIRPLQTQTHSSDALPALGTVYNLLQCEEQRKHVIRNGEKTEMSAQIKENPPRARLCRMISAETETHIPLCTKVDRLVQRLMLQKTPNLMPIFLGFSGR